MRYLITFATYGSHLHGEEPGLVDKFHNRPGGRLLGTDSERASASRRRMTQPPYLLDRESRILVLHSLRQVCLHRNWSLIAAHVRQNHVHVVVDSEVRPEKVMNDFKVYASRSLNAGKTVRKYWARHGSTRWLFQDEAVRNATRYVVEQQGEAMAVFLAEGW